jgi:hypothetical protein
VLCFAVIRLSLAPFPFLPHTHTHTHTHSNAASHLRMQNGLSYVRPASDLESLYLRRDLTLEDIAALPSIVDDNTLAQQQAQGRGGQGVADPLAGCVFRLVDCLKFVSCAVRKDRCERVRHRERERDRGACVRMCVCVSRRRGVVGWVSRTHWLAVCFAWWTASQVCQPYGTLVGVEIRGACVCCVTDRVTGRQADKRKRKRYVSGCGCSSFEPRRTQR